MLYYTILYYTVVYYTILRIPKLHKLLHQYHTTLLPPTHLLTTLHPYTTTLHPPLHYTPSEAPCSAEQQLLIRRLTYIMPVPCIQDVKIGYNTTIYYCLPLQLLLLYDYYYHYSLN
jgi:hypothetical protein